VEGEGGCYRGKGASYPPFVFTECAAPNSGVSYKQNGYWERLLRILEGGGDDRNV